MFKSFGNINCLDLWSYETCALLNKINLRSSDHEYLEQKLYKKYTSKQSDFTNLVYFEKFIQKKLRKQFLTEKNYV